MPRETVSSQHSPIFTQQRSITPRREQPQEQVNRFSGKMEQLQRRETEQQKEPNKANGKDKKKGDANALPNGTLRQVLKEKVDERDAKHDGGIGQQFITTLAPVNKAMATAPAAPPEAPPAHLDRIAAAIAELSGKDVDVHFQLNLPMGNTQIESALIGRDAMGRLSVQLTANAVLPPEQMAKMSAELSRRLREKKLRIGDIGFSKHEAPVDPKTGR
jgi:hypothetical protein